MTALYKTISFLNNLDSLLAAFCGGAFIFLLTNYHGVGISPDSVTYVSVARNVQLGKGLVEFNDNPLIIFPAGYPLFLAFFSSLTTLDVLKLAPWLNGFLVAVSIYLIGFQLSKFEENNKWLKRCVLAILPISYALIDVYTMLWSETLFMVWIGLFFVFLQQYFRKPILLHLLLPTCFVALACVTRIAGVSLLATGSLLLLLQPNQQWAKKLIHLVVFIVGSVSLLAINLMRNQLVNGTLTGIRQKSITPFWLNLQYVGETILLWFQLPNNNRLIALGVGVSVIIWLGLSIFIKLCFQKKAFTFQIIHFSFCCIYICFILFTATISKYERINSRLLSPAFVSLLFSLFTSFKSTFKYFVESKWQYLTTILLITVYVSFQFAQGIEAYAYQNQLKENGIPGYTEIGWHESSIVQWLQKHQTSLQPQQLVFSNVSDAVYFYGGIPAFTLPEKVHIAEVKEYYEMEDNYIIWFNNEFDNKAIIRLSDLGLHRHLDTIQRFQDGLLLLSTRQK